MKIINNGLPAVIYEWLCQDFYDTEAAKNSISATSLKKPVQEYILTQRHIDELEVDATDRIWSLFGSSVHAVLDKLEGDTEERLFAEVAGRTVSGKYDRVQNDALYDYKVTSAWTVAYGSRLEEWKHQLSVYRYLYWTNKKIVLSEYAYIIAILRDWNRKDAERGGKYPQLPILEIPVLTYPLNEILDIMEAKIETIKAAERLPDDKLPECTKEERWWNEKREEYIKCDKYCLARKFCQQIKRYEE